MGTAVDQKDSVIEVSSYMIRARIAEFTSKLSPGLFDDTHGRTLNRDLENELMNKGSQRWFREFSHGMARSTDVTPESIMKIIGVNANFADENVQTYYGTVYDSRWTRS